MKIKKLLLAVLMIAVIFLFSGCSKFGIEISELIVPPEPTGELYEIRQALYDFAGENITLRYPKSGDWRSAFIVEDIDGDGVEDAIAFYSTTSAENTTIMHINLITKLEGTWISVSDNAVESSSIESVEFKKLSDDEIPEIIVCWKVASQPTDKISVYSFSNGGLTLNIHVDCTKYVVCNLDDGTEQEIVILANDSISKSAKATVYRIDRHGVTNLGGCPLDCEVTEYYNATLSRLNSGKPALYIDAAKSTIGTVTDVVYIDDKGILANLFIKEVDGINTATLRASNATCYDIDGDEDLEIPLITQLPGIRGNALNETEIVYLTEWHKCSEQGLEYLESALMNYADNYLIRVDEEWKGGFTVSRSLDLTERIFHNFDVDMELATEEQFRIKVVPKAEYQNTKSELSDFFQIASNEEIVVLGKINLKNSWGVTEDNLKNRFEFID